MGDSLKNQIDFARNLGSRGNFAEAIELLEKTSLELDRETFTGSDLWLNAQAGIISLLGWNGLQQMQLSLDRFDAVREDFERHARRTDWPDPADETKAKIRHCGVAWKRIRTYYEMGRLADALEAAKYANEVFATVPDSAARDEQKACLLVECAAVLRGLNREEDASLLSAEAVEIIRTRYSARASDSHSSEVSALEDIGDLALSLISRLDDLGLYQESRDLAIEYRNAEQRLVELEPDAIEHKHGLARSTEALGIAYYRLGDSRSWEYLESASEIHRSSTENGDLIARAHLARIQKNVGVMRNPGNVEEMCRAFRESLYQYRILWRDKGHQYGPALLDVLQKFCAATTELTAFEEENRAALDEANRLICGLSDDQKRECAYAIGWCYLTYGKTLMSAAQPDLRSAHKVLGKALSALRQSEHAGWDATRELREAKELRFTIASTIPISSRPPRKHERKQQQILRNMLVVAGALFAIAIGSIVLMTFDVEDDVQCARIETDADGEQVCVQFKTREGVIKRSLPPTP